MSQKDFDLGKGTSVSFTEEKGLIFRDGALLGAKNIHLSSEQALRLMVFLSLPPQRQELLDPVINPRNY